MYTRIRTPKSLLSRETLSLWPKTEADFKDLSGFPVHTQSTIQKAVCMAIVRQGKSRRAKEMTQQIALTRKWISQTKELISLYRKMAALTT